MKKIQIIILFIAMGIQVAHSQNINVTVENINLRSDSAYLNFDRANFSLQNGATFENTGTVQIDGDWSQDSSSSYAGSGNLVFNGGNCQQVSGLGNLQNIEVTNNDTIILQSQMTITGTLRLTNGKIMLNNHDLFIADNANIVGANSNNYIITNMQGGLKMNVENTVVQFPIGGDTYNPAKLKNTGTTDTFKLRVLDNSYAKGDSGTILTSDAINRTWLVEESTPGGSNVDLRLVWNSNEEMTGFDRTQTAVAHYTSGSWNIPASFTASSSEGSNFYSQVRTGLSSFSPFTLADNSSPLPVELIDFNAQLIGTTKAKLTWETASEINNSHFEIERSTDGIGFTYIGEVQGAGNSNQLTPYTFLDNNLNPNTSHYFYRLKQVDFDGEYEYSKVRKVNLSPPVSSFSSYPNPFSNVINLSFSKLVDDRASVHLYDLNGKLLLNKPIEVSSSNATIKTDLLPAGIYILEINTDINTQSFRVVKF